MKRTIFRKFGQLGLVIGWEMLGGICQAQEAPTPTPSPIALASQFQPGAYQPGDMTVLQRIEFVPNPVQFPGPRPIALVVHAGLFKGGDFNDAVNGLFTAISKMPAFWFLGSTTFWHRPT